MVVYRLSYRGLDLSGCWAVIVSVRVLVIREVLGVTQRTEHGTSLTSPTQST